MITLVTLGCIAYLGRLASGQITVNTASKLQEINGFGFSQAFGRAKEFQQTDATRQREALDLLFNTTTGAGFSIIRNRIGSGGTGDSILPSSPGSPSGAPKYNWDKDDKGQVWFSKQAMSYGVNIVYADSWSAPGFMKTSGNEASAGYLCGTTGHTCSSGDWRQAFANFLVQYINFYAEEGIKVTHLEFLNEPEFRASYSQMQISNGAQEASSFIPILYNTTRAANLSVALTCCDAEGWNMQKTFTAGLVSAGMEQYLSVITSHAYTTNPTSPINTKLPTWLTEASSQSAFSTAWGSGSGSNEGMNWANKIAVGIINANLSAFLYWEGYENKQQQAASHLIDTDGTKAVPSGIFWAFTMWSRFIRPGAFRLATEGSLPSVLTGAFKNVDGSLVLVFTNTGSSSQSAKVTLAGMKPTSATAYISDNTHKCDSTPVTLSDTVVSVAVPGRSVVTVKLI